MRLKINFFFYLFISNFFLYHSVAQNFKYFDKIYNLFKEIDVQNISIIKNAYESEDDKNIIVIENQYFDVIRSYFSNDLNFKESKIYNTLYYVKIDNIVNYKNEILPLVFSESFNNNWELLNISEEKIDFNHFDHFLNYFKFKFFLNSPYEMIEYSHHLSNNFSNLFLIKNNKNLSGHFLIYYKKSFMIQLFWIFLIFVSPLLIFFSIFIGRSNKNK